VGRGGIAGSENSGNEMLGFVLYRYVSLCHVSLMWKLGYTHNCDGQKELCSHIHIYIYIHAHTHTLAHTHTHTHTHTQTYTYIHTTTYKKHSSTRIQTKKDTHAHQALGPPCSRLTQVYLCRETYEGQRHPTPE